MIILYNERATTLNIPATQKKTTFAPGTYTKKKKEREKVIEHQCCTYTNKKRKKVIKCLYCAHTQKKVIKCTSCAHTNKEKNTT